LSSLSIYTGRNGHTATLADGRLFIIGGWLGSGPLAASDVHYLDLGELRKKRGKQAHRLLFGSPPALLIPRLPPIYTIHPSIHPSIHRPAAANKWVEAPLEGTPPGACNMHTSDYMADKRCILVFRGGDGAEYLNDLHSLDVDTFRRVCACVPA
jgi:hypothetical protein